MKEYYKKIIFSFVIFISGIVIGINSYAHSGRTDSNGGHKDNKNVSGLGSYHYHCGGHPAHLHEGGVCPYSSSSKSSTTTSSSQIQQTKPSTIDVNSIKINEDIVQMKVGERKTLTATISTNDATDKNIIWKSEDENIITVSQNGDIVAIKTGETSISASTSNGKISTIKISVQEEQVTNTAMQTIKTNTNNNQISNDSKSEEENTVGGIIMLGILGGGGYYGYKKYKQLHNK